MKPYINIFIKCFLLILSFNFLYCGKYHTKKNINRMNIVRTIKQRLPKILNYVISSICNTYDEFSDDIMISDTDSNNLEVLEKCRDGVDNSNKENFLIESVLRTIYYGTLPIEDECIDEIVNQIIACVKSRNLKAYDRNFVKNIGLSMSKCLLRPTDLDSIIFKLDEYKNLDSVYMEYDYISQIIEVLMEAKSESEALINQIKENGLWQRKADL